MRTWLTLFAAVAISFGAGCRKQVATTVMKPVASPDGSMVAEPHVTDLVVVVIKDKAGASRYRWETGASSYQRWDIQWLNNQKLLLDSNDIGAVTLERLPDGTWREAAPGQVFSPDGKLVVSTSWQSGGKKKLHLWFGNVTGRRSYAILGTFSPDLVVETPFDCARWDGNQRVIITASDGEHGWVMQKDQHWVQEK